YPADRRNNDDDESSNDDDDDDDVEKEEEDTEEEEHPAPADPSDVLTDDLVPSSCEGYVISTNTQEMGGVFKPKITKEDVK
nr:hypothetical protein [Tanacetum cinerariifolium]